MERKEKLHCPPSGGESALTHNVICFILDFIIEFMNADAQTHTVQTLNYFLFPLNVFYITAFGYKRFLPLIIKLNFLVHGPT